MKNFSTIKNTHFNISKSIFQNKIIANPNRIEGGLRLNGFFKKNDPENFLISVITVVYNAESSIENSIISVLEQDYENVEYIIIDGGSTDGTLDLIKKYDSYIDYWVSERDKGIGDAWNKGIKLCTGYYIGILNADDIYSNTNLSELNKLIKQNNNHNIVYYGNCYYLSEGKIVKQNLKIFDQSELLNGINFAHTTCFISKQIYQQVGLFNTSYKIAVDTEYILRIFKFGGEFKKGNLKTYMSLGGISDKYFKRGQLEYTRALKELELAKISQIKKRNRFVKRYSLIRKIKSTYIYFLLKKKIEILLKSFFNFTYSKISSKTLKILLLKIFAINIGKNSTLGKPYKLSNFGNISIGNNTKISERCILDNKEKIKIGNNVRIEVEVELITSKPDSKSPYLELDLKPIIIEDNVHIQANAKIEPGVTIKKGALIISKSIVNKDVEEYEIFKNI